MVMDHTEEVKKILRSLLVSTPLKVTVSSLNRDYKELEGCYIPFKELGYNSLLHFLHSIPDVLKVNGSSHESEVALVVSKKTAHVNDLVMKQRKPTKGRNAGRSRKSLVSHLKRTSISNLDYSKSRPYQPVSLNSKYKQETQYFSLYPGGSLSSQPLKNSFPESVSLGSQPPFTKPITDRVPNLPSSPQHLLLQSVTDGVPNPQSHLTQSPTDVLQEFVPQTENNVPVIPKSLSPFPRPLLSPPKLNRPSLKKRLASIKLYNDENQIEKVEIEASSKKCSKMEKLRQRLAKVKTMEQNITVTFRNDQMDNEIGVVQIEHDGCSKIPPEVKINLQNLISRYPNGLWNSKLPLEYQALYGKDLNFEKYGFGCLINLCMTLEDIFFWRKESDSDFKLYDRRQPIPMARISSDLLSSEAQSDRNTKEIDPFTIKAAQLLDYSEFPDLPKDIFKLGEEIENNLIEKFEVGDKVQIVVSEICSPEKFWVYKDNGELNTMMNSMQNFYRENKSKYLIPEYLLEVGLFCVVYTQNEFQRALIVDLLPDIGGHVKIFFIDYGTFCNLPREKVWFLSREFSVLPSQAIKAKLSGIKPKIDNWPKESTLRFRNFITSKYVFAKITAKEDRTIAVQIADRQTPLKIINDVLVEEGYAEHIQETSEVVTPAVPRRSRGISKLIEKKKMRMLNNGSPENKNL